MIHIAPSIAIYSIKFTFFLMHNILSVIPEKGLKNGQKTKFYGHLKKPYTKVCFLDVHRTLSPYSYERNYRAAMDGKFILLVYLY